MCEIGELLDTYLCRYETRHNNVLFCSDLGKTYVHTLDRSEGIILSLPGFQSSGEITQRAFGVSESTHSQVTTLMCASTWLGQDCQMILRFHSTSGDGMISENLATDRTMDPCIISRITGETLSSVDSLLGSAPILLFV